MHTLIQLWYSEALHWTRMKKDRIVKSELRNVIEEARTILPGVQALFGIQTMPVFNTRFDEFTNRSNFHGQVSHQYGTSSKTSPEQ
jgi:hypothetical protein